MTDSTLVERRRPCARRTLVCVTSLLCASVSLPTLAHAQTVAPAPARTTIDQNSVDLFTGTLIVRGPSISMGQGDQGMSYAYENWGTGFADSVGGALNQTASVATVSIGRFTDDFNVSGSTFTSIQAQGATLTLSGGIYTYTAPDGTVAHFDSSKTITTPYFGSLGMLTDVVSPSGARRTYNYDYANGCLHMTGSICTVHQNYYRLSTIVNSFGYEIGFTYQLQYYDESTSPDPVGDFKRWKNPVGGAALSNLENVSAPVLRLKGTTGSGTFVVTDPMSRSTTYRLSGSFVAGVTYPGSAGENVTITYSGSRVATLTNTSGTWTYSATDNVGANTRTVVVTDPTSHSTTYVFNLTTARMTSKTDALSRTTSWQYDPTTALPTRVTLPEGNYTQYGYDGRGNVTTTTMVAKSGSGLSNIVTYANYSPTCTNAKTCNKPISTTDARGNTTSYAYDATHGGVTTLTAPAPTSGAVQPEVRVGYTGYTDYLGGTVYLPTSTSTCRTTASCAGGSDEVVSSTSYGSLSANNLLPVGRSAGAGDGSLTATTSVTYDAVGNVATATDPMGAVTNFYYDADRERTLTVGPDPDGAGALKNRAVRNNYNADGTVSSVEAGTANANGTGFVSLQQVTTSYDSALRKTSDRLTAGGTTYGVTQYSYDAVGRPDCTAQRMNSSVWGSLPSSACTAQTTGSYGPDRIVKTSYDVAGQVTKVQSAYGVTGTQADEATATYNLNGTTATVTDAAGNTTTYTYDGVDRLAKTQYPSTTTGAGTSSATDYEQLTYDPGGNVTSRRLRDGTSIGATYDALGRMTLMDLDGSGIDQDITYAYDLQNRMIVSYNATGHLTSYNYDALGRAVAEYTTYAGGSGSKTSSYDLAGRRTRLTWPDGFYVAYDYDATGAMTKVRENGATSGVGVLATYAYDDLGRRTTLTRGNGVVTSYGYDTASRLTSLASDLSGSTYDVTTTFAYNPAGQITSSTRSNDLYAWTGAANVNRNYTTNGLNQYSAAGGTSLGYDAKGNLNVSGSNGYTYSQRNQLKGYAIGATSGTVYYDPPGRLDVILGTGVSTTFDYDGDRLATEATYGVTSVDRRYVFGAHTDEPLVWYEGAGTTDRRWLVADERGSIVAVTNASGAKLAINTYDEYGIPGSGNMGRFQYTGQAWIPELGMYYYKARMYSPTLGRFMQTDPIGYGDGMNWYNYVGGDPVNGSDPSGLDKQAPGEAGGVCNGPGADLIIACDIIVPGQRDGGGTPYDPNVVSICGGRGTSGCTGPSPSVGINPSPLGDGSEGRDIVVTDCKKGILIAGVCVEVDYKHTLPPTPISSWTPSRIVQCGTMTIGGGVLVGSEFLEGGVALWKGESLRAITNGMIEAQMGRLAGRAMSRAIIITAVAVATDFAFNDGKITKSVGNWMCPAK